MSSMKERRIDERSVEWWVWGTRERGRKRETNHLHPHLNPAPSRGRKVNCIFMVRGCRTGHEKYFGVPLHGRWAARTLAGMF
jgi:hypothetical protein